MTMTKQPKAEAAYLALARDLRTAILENRYAEGDRLPTEAELVASYRVSRQTVRHAMQNLVSEGMVYRVPGRGTFPTPHGGKYLRHFGSIEDLMGLSLDTTLELVNPLHRRVDPAAASRLRLDADVVLTVIFRRVHAGVPFCYTTVHLPPAIGSQLLDLPELTLEGCKSDITVIGTIDERCGVSITYAEQSITVAELPQAAAEVLEAKPRQPVMRTDRIYFGAADQAIELAISYFLPDYYSYRVRLLRSVS